MSENNMNGADNCGLTQEDLKLLTDWFDQNKDHRMNFLEKEAIKLAVRKADTVGDLRRPP